MNITARILLIFLVKIILCSKCHDTSPYRDHSRDWDVSRHKETPITRQNIVPEFLLSQLPLTTRTQVSRVL